jgi:hypothetical protein
MATTDFEGLVAPNGSSDTIPFGYDGFDWYGFGVLGKKYLDNTIVGVDDGYHHVIANKTVGFTQLDEDGNVDSTLILPGPGQTFTIKSGTFAAAWNTGETVTFHAFGSAGEFTKVVVLNQTATDIHFGKHFKHIIGLVITSEGGTDANAGDGGAGANIAMDNLKLIIDTAAQVLGEHPIESAHQFGVVHSGDWALF